MNPVFYCYVYGCASGGFDDPRVLGIVLVYLIFLVIVVALGIDWIKKHW